MRQAMVLWCMDIGETILSVKEVYMLMTITRLRGLIGLDTEKYDRLLEKLDSELVNLNMCKEYVSMLKARQKQVILCL